MTEHEASPMPTVDIVVPCYRYGHYLRDCVGSLLAQTGCEVRVLVIDDASPDDSATVARQIAAEDPRVEVIVHATNRGHIATYNEGIAWSSSKYFLLLSADDLLVPGALGRAVAIMEAHPEVSWTYGREILLHEGETLEQAYALQGFRPESTPAWRVMPGEAFISRLCTSGINEVATCTAVVRGEVQRRIGGYRPELPHAGDLEMWLRLSSVGSVGEVDGFQGVRRLHASNMINDFLGVSDLRQREEAYESFFTTEGRDLPATPLWRRQLRRTLAHQAARWGIGGLRRGQFRYGMGCLALAFRVDPAAAVRAPMDYLERLPGFGARRSAGQG
jgi:glycosyltransferase involved in cell wall biosynthesis